MILLADLLGERNFEESVQEIALGFREKAAIPFKINQLGVVVPSVESAVSDLEKSGLGPFFIASATLPYWIERGEQRTFRGKLAVAYHRGIELELLESGSGSDFYRQSLDPRGRPVVQHVGFVTRNVDEWSDKLERQCPIWVRGRIKALLFSIDFVYLDSASEADIIIEFIDIRISGIPVGIPPSVYRVGGWLQKKSGIKCIRF